MLRLSLLENKQTSRPTEVRHRAESRYFGRDITNLEHSNRNVSYVVHPPKSVEVIRIRTSVHSKIERVQKVLLSSATGDSPWEHETSILERLSVRDQPAYPLISQKDVTEKMRAVLFDWIVDVHQSFKLSCETLHLAFRYIQDFLNNQQVNRLDLQLLGITCLWIAAKFQETKAPSLKSMVDVTANCYNKQDFLKMEQQILELFEFSMLRTTSCQILKMLTKGYKQECLAQFIAETAYLEGLGTRFKPSVIGVAAARLACKHFGVNMDCQRECKIFEINNYDIDACTHSILGLFRQSKYPSLKAIKRKYSKDKYGAVSQLKL